MSKIVYFEKSELGSFEANIRVKVEVRPPRIEECHGVHYFNDDEEISRTLLSAVISVGGLSIDITDRLTEREREFLIDLDGIGDLSVEDEV